MANPLRRFAVLPIAVLSVLGICAVVAPSSQAAANCGGTKIAKTGGGYWTCSWDDEFSLTYLDKNKWTVGTTASSGVSAGGACFVNTAKNVYENSGTLKLVVRKVTQPFVCSSPTGSFTTQFTAGEVFSWSKFSQLYGRFEIRAAFPAARVQGLQEALWMWPDNPVKYGAWPASGEIDIAEAASMYPDRAVPFIHYDSGTNMNVTNNYCKIVNINYMHKYTLEWTPSTMTISYDGTMCLQDVYNPRYPATSSKPFDQPFFLALTQGLGADPNGYVAGKTPLPGVTRIDYVRVWT